VGVRGGNVRSSTRCAKPAHRPAPTKWRCALAARDRNGESQVKGCLLRQRQFGRLPLWTGRRWTAAGLTAFNRHPKNKRRRKPRFRAARAPKSFC